MRYLKNRRLELRQKGLIGADATDERTSADLLSPQHSREAEKEPDANVHFKKNLKVAAGVTFSDRNDVIRGGAYRPRGKNKMTTKEYQATAGRRIQNYRGGLAEARRGSEAAAFVRTESQPGSPRSIMIKEKESLTWLPEGERVFSGTSSRLIFSVQGSRRPGERGRAGDLNTGREKMINHSGLGVNMLMGFDEGFETSREITVNRARDKAATFLTHAWQPPVALALPIKARGSGGAGLSEPQSPPGTAQSAFVSPARMRQSSVQGMRNMAGLYSAQTSRRVRFGMSFDASRGAGAPEDVNRVVNFQGMQGRSAERREFRLQSVHDKLNMMLHTGEGDPTQFTQRGSKFKIAKRPLLPRRGKF